MTLSASLRLDSLALTQRCLLGFGAAVWGWGCTTTPLDLGANNPRVVVSLSNDPMNGVGGRLKETVSTALQPAQWQEGLFQQPGMGAQLQRLAPAHVLIQVENFGAMPLVYYDPDAGARDDAAAWDFSELDPIVDGVVEAGADPVIQLGAVPTPAMPPGANVNTTSLMREYAAALVSYYNHGSFPWGKITIRRDGGAEPVTWWSVLADFNTLSMNGQQYAELYSGVVPSMVQASPTPIRLSAFEYADAPGTGISDPGQDLALFLSNVTGAQVDAISLHFFGTSLEDAGDKSVFGRTQEFFSNFATVLEMVRAIDAGGADSGLTPNPNTPVWVTETNVQSAVPNSAGYFAQEPDVPFVNDVRGTTAFFAAWKPYLFSVLGKAGNEGLFQWEFTAGYCRPPNTSYCASATDGGTLDLDPQSAEVNFADGTPYLSYWVDYWLGQFFSGTPKILDVPTNTDPDDIEVLATESDGGAVVVMVVNHAFDPNVSEGPGLQRTVLVDLPSGLTYSTASELLLDARTPLAVKPTPVPVTLADDQWIVSFDDGYGVAFLELQ